MRQRLLCAASFTALAAPAFAQGPPCPAFPVNTFTTGFQVARAVSADPSGGFLVLWTSDGQSGFNDIYGQRFNAGGERQGTEFRISPFTASAQQEPSVARSASGDFVVVWATLADSEIFGRWFSTSGAPLGAAFPVNETQTGFQLNPSVAAAADGSFVATWYSEHAVPGGVYARRFDASGTPLGPEFRVNSAAFNGQIPKLAGDPSGRFVVVWASYQDGDQSGIFGRRYDAQGNPQGPEFRVNTYTTGAQGWPEVAVQANGDFAVVWRSLGQDGNGWGIFGQRYDAAGQPLGPEFRVNAYTTGSQAEARLAFDAYGNLEVIWQHQDTGFKSVVYAQRFGRSGAPEGGQFRVSGPFDYEANIPAVAAAANGFVVAWSGNRPGFDMHAVSASLDCGRLYTLSPCRLADTRNPPAPLGANTSRVFPVAGSCGIPPDARAVALNVTAVKPTDAGNLRVHAAGSAVPLASAVNFVPGRTRANNAVVMLGTDGGIRVQCDMPAGSTGQTNLVLDVFGYFKR
jgi:hypothetical protein